MKASISAAALARFRIAITARLGLRFDEERSALLANVLTGRLKAFGGDTHAYFERIEAHTRSHEEWGEIAQALTVGETYFFRHADQLAAFTEVALPERIRARAQTKTLRLLSAGCASGEEAYTLSILTRQHLPDLSWDAAITGVDINPKAVQRAQRARYTAWSLRETPQEVQRQWFVAEGREHVVGATAKAGVSFLNQNLLTDDSWSNDSYDVVFCRNVLMYFDPESAAHVVRTFARALAEGGFLFLGHAENLRGLSQDFRLRHTHRAFYYERASGQLPASAELPPAAVRAASESVPLDSENVVEVGWATTWLETVRRSAERIQSLAEQASPKTKPAPTSTPAKTQRLNLAPSLELLAQERFEEALAVLEVQPSTALLQLDALLLRAALLTHSGQLSAAESVCAELLQRDQLNSGAHFLLALCSERNGELGSAIDHARIASHLDPSFAMPRLHLALMARRSGDRDAAERELRRAWVLLQNESAYRVSLFGGGFNRDGLAALCRSELESLGASP